MIDPPPRRYGWHCRMKRRVALGPVVQRSSISSSETSSKFPRVSCGERLGQECRFARTHPPWPSPQHRYAPCRRHRTVVGSQWLPDPLFSERRRPAWTPCVLLRRPRHLRLRGRGRPPCQTPGQLPSRWPRARREYPSGSEASFPVLCHPNVCPSQTTVNPMDISI